MNIGNGSGVGDMGGSADFAQKLLGSLGLGGGRNSQSVSGSNNSSISVSPTFVQTGSGSPNVAPYVGGASGTPSSSASASSAGTDPSRLTTPTSLYRPTTGYAADPLNAYGTPTQGNDLMLPLLLGAGALLFFLND